METDYRGEDNCGAPNMQPLTWFRSLRKSNAKKKEKANNKKNKRQREHSGKTLTFSITQNANSVGIHGDSLSLQFAVEGIDLPQNVDASFSVWSILPAAMAAGFNVHIEHPIDPVVAANAEQLTRIWEMWIPNRYRSVTVSGEGEWSRNRKQRFPRVDLYSGGVDSTYSILQSASLKHRGYALTVRGLDYRDKNASAKRFPELISKTAPLLKKINYQQTVVRTDARFDPLSITHGFTLASCLFLLSDLFEEGTIAADQTLVQDMVTFPWGNNHLTNHYLAGSDFAMRTVGADLTRTEKLAVIAGSGVALPFLSFCRKPSIVPSNCGRCDKCVRTKVMLAAAIGRVPEIFIDSQFNKDFVKRLETGGRGRADVFEIYHYALQHGHIDAVPGLLELVEECRQIETPDPREL